MKPNGPTLDLWNDIITFIVEYKIQSGGESPTYRQIADATGHGTTAISWNLKRMDSLGLIRMPEKAHHGIGIPGERYLPPPELDAGVKQG